MVPERFLEIALPGLVFLSPDISGSISNKYLLFCFWQVALKKELIILKISCILSCSGRARKKVLPLWSVEELFQGRWSLTESCPQCGDFQCQHLWCFYILVSWTELCEIDKNPGALVGWGSVHKQNHYHWKKSQRLNFEHGSDVNRKFCLAV